MTTNCLDLIIIFSVLILFGGGASRSRGPGLRARRCTAGWANNAGKSFGTNILPEALHTLRLADTLRPTRRHSWAAGRRVASTNNWIGWRGLN